MLRRPAQKVKGGAPGDTPLRQRLRIRQTIKNRAGIAF
jgi:hypothetical protein